MTIEYEKAVCKGAILLDEMLPNWYMKIKINDLHMHSCSACILGQLFKDYWNGTEEIDRFLEQYETDERMYGFNSFGPHDDDGAAYKLLKDLWIKEIVKRKDKNEKA